MKKRDLLLVILFVGIIFISIRVSADGSDLNCGGVFSAGFVSDLNKYVFKPIKWLTPIVLIVLTSIDFAGVVFSGDSKGMDKAKNNFMKRAVAALIIFFAPNILNLIFQMTNPDLSACLDQLGLQK